MNNSSTWRRHLGQKCNGWYVISGIGALAALLPSLYILTGLLGKPNENWAHIREYMLLDYAKESLLLMGGTVVFTVLIGVTLAWLTTAYDFPFRRLFSFLFVLPLAIPPYIAAYTYASMLSYTGSVQTFLRNSLGMTVNQSYFDIMSMKGAIFIFTMFLYPYVYLITKSFLERNSAVFIENARLLGQRPLAIFFKVVLPLSQGAIVGGASLVAFEVLNDYGVSKHYGIQTFTVAIFKTWFGMYDVDSAIRLSAMLMSVIIGVFVVERLLRRRKRYNGSTKRTLPLQRRRLHGGPAVLAVVFSLAVALLSFIIPVAQLIVWATWTFEAVWDERFAAMIRNTLTMAFGAVSILMVLAVIAANANRTWRSNATLIMSKLLSMGYSIPGAVLSIGVLAVFLSVDERLAGLYEAMGLGANKLVLSMSLAMLIFALVIRFLAVGFNAVDAGFDKVGTRYSEASRMLGYGVTRTFFKVDLPMLKGAVLTGFIMAFLEVVKELPLTLLLRPFNFDTLATKAYQYASDEMIHEASTPSLIIIGFGIVSVCLYQWLGRRESV
ncbi:iron ABC transporter permease [Paenibacillus sp. J5C_2022]|uniref:ABC transporter permease n=1 Tax=Paenibacillus sp. J5C2022 TaxID=2977129 RepID=UPI0021CF4054|nr:iron ABC transporter permease [Paenibacillus sp. J5C2022]MCU6710886.1 iron ABC transporter permease [Paenibacillus sp. J5C2022]